MMAQPSPGSAYIHSQPPPDVGIGGGGGYGGEQQSQEPAMTGSAGRSTTGGLSLAQALLNPDCPGLDTSGTCRMHSRHIH